MSSFELKPQGSTNETDVNLGAAFIGGTKALAKALPSIDEIVWTHPRYPIPSLLVGRVSDDTWACTFDAVKARVGADLQFQRDQLEGGASCLPLIPCCVCCIVCASFGSFGDLQQQAMMAQREWLALAESEQQRYRPVGVSVTVAKEIRTRGGGSHRRIAHETVGLRFEVGPAPATTTTDACAPAYVPTTTTAPAYVPSAQKIDRADHDIVAKLEKLNQLHLTGALDKDEYAAAKAKLLNQ